MSYILDALRKSDQQRRRHVAPTLLTLQPSAVVRKRPAYVTYGLLAVILIGGGVVIGWLRPWQSEPAAVKPVESRQIESKPVESKPLEPKPLEFKPGAPAPAASEIAAQAKRDNVLPEANSLASGKTAPPPPERRVDIAAADAAGETVVEMEKLPTSLRDEVSKITVSVHAYSNTPEKRLVGIGRRILHEGDYVTPGLKLEEITPDGMILGYKGYRFRRGVK